MAYSLKNSLFVRNLSPNISETVLREVFEECDEIEKVVFKPYPSNASQFFAQIDFVSSKGVAEGSKLSGTSIMGVACSCGVIDPVQLMSMPSLPGELDVEKIDEAMRQEYDRRQKEAEEDQRFRTVHISNLPADATEENLRILANNFGEIHASRIERNDGAPYGLVEFKERGPAHVCKTQREFLVDGRRMEITEAKVFVDESGFQERNVHFQNQVLDAMNMRSVLLTQEEMKGKINAVRAAASEMFGQPRDAAPAKAVASLEPEAPGAEAAVEESSGEAALRRKRKKEKQEKKERRLRKKQKKEARMRKKERIAQKLKEKEEKLKKQREGDVQSKSESAEEEEPSESGSEEAGAIDIDDDELEVVPNSELLVLGSSSSSSSSDGEEERKAAEEKKRKEEEEAKAKEEEERAKRAKAAKAPLGKNDVWDIDAVLEANVLDVDEEEARKEERRKRRKELTKKIITTTESGCCSVPGCVRPAGHDGPHIDTIGSTLIVKKIEPKGGQRRGRKRKAKVRARSSSPSSSKSS